MSCPYSPPFSTEQASSTAVKITWVGVHKYRAPVTPDLCTEYNYISSSLKSLEERERDPSIHQSVHQLFDKFLHSKILGIS